jgi:hypothetical protein
MAQAIHIEAELGKHIGIDKKIEDLQDKPR